LQADTLSAIFRGLTSSGATGLQGIVYRSLVDSYMDPANYYGLAESHWGLKRSDGSAKAAWNMWASVATGSSTPAPAPAPTPPPTPAVSMPGSVEAEAMSASAGGKGADAAASGGAYWNLWSNGQLSQSVSSQGGAYRVSVVARGTPLAGVNAHMDLLVGGARVAGYDVTTSWATYAADVTLPAGSTTLAVAFTNDASSASEDRNLLVDVVKVAAPVANAAPVAKLSTSGSGLSWSFDGSA